MTYPVSDLMIRIKNGYMARNSIVEADYSKFKEEIVKKLKELNFIEDYSVSGETKRTITLRLLYKEGMPAITDVKLFSTPGRRWYVPAKDLKTIMGGLGFSIVSSSKGILTGREAKKNNLGGELLFNIW